jgi:hypothetical protein
MAYYWCVMAVENPKNPHPALRERVEQEKVEQEETPTLALPRSTRGGDKME